MRERAGERLAALTWMSRSLGALLLSGGLSSILACMKRWGGKKKKLFEGRPPAWLANDYTFFLRRRENISFPFLYSGQEKGDFADVAKKPGTARAGMRKSN